MITVIGDCVVPPVLLVFEFLGSAGRARSPVVREERLVPALDDLLLRQRRDLAVTRPLQRLGCSGKRCP
jgi:hypothetical protein